MTKSPRPYLVWNHKKKKNDISTINITLKSTRFVIEQCSLIFCTELPNFPCIGPRNSIDRSNRIIIYFKISVDSSKNLSEFFTRDRVKTKKKLEYDL